MTARRTALSLLLLISFVLGSCLPFPMQPGAADPTPARIVPPTLAPLPTRPPSPSQAADGRLAIRPIAAGSYGVYDLVELELETDLSFVNPFDPGEIDLRVVFSSPSGDEIDIGAFWYRRFRPPGILGDGEAGWKARFTPTESGEWSAVARIPARGLESAPVTFTVVESENPGFVRVHPENPRYLALDDGGFFFPIGLNMGWWTGAGTAHGDYGKWMTSFARHGGNTIRVWMAEWSFGIEWNNTPLGDYSNRLGKAWLLDEIFRMAEEQDVYIILVLLNCADFNNWQTNGWNGNPYNAARGGPLERPEDFATDPEARAYLQRKLNYIVNRWGYSPNLLAWEWWNEVNLTPISDEALIPWLEETTGYLRSRDVNHHLVTNSYAIRDLSPIWDLPEMDIIQKHEYADQVDSPHKDLADRAAADFARLAESAPPKPILLGEFGVGAEANAENLDRSGIHLHNGLWSTTFAGYAGTGMYWYWDIYIEVNNLWHHYRNLDQFLQGVDLTRYQPFSPLDLSGPRGEAPAVGLGLRGDDVLVWLRSDGYTIQAVRAAHAAAGSPRFFAYSYPLVEGLELVLDEMPDGEYVINWYDPQKGEWMSSARGEAQGGRLTVAVPDFRRDLAARIRPVQ